MNTLFIRSAMAVALTTAGSSIAGTPAPSPAEEMTVTSSRVEMPLRHVGTSVSVLDTDDIQSRGYKTVAEVLRSLPAIGISNNGGLGKQTTIRIRGEEGYRTKVLIDGIDVSDPTGTQVQTQIQHLLTAHIERIEVLRGPQGMMYGADAGGVINIITKKASAPLQGGLSVDYGRFDSRQYTANLRGQINTFDYSIMAADLSTEGFNARESDLSKDNDGYENTSLGFSGGYNVSDSIRLQAIIRNVDSDNEYDNCSAEGVGITSNCNGEFEQTNYKLAASFSNEQWQHTLSYGYTKTERTNFAEQSINTFDVDGKLKHFQYHGAYQMLDHGQWVFGIDRQRDKVNSSANHYKRKQHSTYVEWQGNIDDRFYYTTGVRYDYNNSFGSNISYRLTSAYLIALTGGHELKIKGAVGTGFRAPSLSEIATNDNATSLPAAGVILEQEDSQGIDLGAELRFANGVLIEAVYFHQEIDNEISFDLIGFSGYLQESGISQSKGVELSFEAPLSSNVNLYGNYTFNETKDSENLQRIRRPKQLLNLGADVTFNTLSISANARHVADAQDQIYGLGRLDLDDYQVLDINISVQVLPDLDVYVRAENVFNKQYQQITDYQSARAASYVGFRYHF